MGFTNESVEQYLEGILPGRDPVLTDIEALADRDRIPIVGPVVGRLLEQLARMIHARRVFELGSAVGYSTIWWARGVAPDGHVYFSDFSPENTARAREYFERAELIDRVTLLTGDSLDLLDQTDGEFDIVFNDIDKHYYPEVYKRASGRVRVGGLLVADNVLWGGKVADPKVRDRDTDAIREFNRLAYDDPRYLTTILPIRDGVLVGWRVQ